MGLFDTYFVWFGQVLAVSWLKTLVIIISHRCVHASGKITTVPRLFSEHSTQNGNKHQIMNIQLNGIV